MPKTAAERFWEKVDKSSGDNGCWTWTASGDGRYGTFYLNGKKVKAHRVSWEMSNGRSFPEGKDACHTCDNPACVNPAHIWPGTKSENAMDAVRKGRVNTGNLQPRKKMTHCLRGHELTPDNVYTNPSSGRRTCRICRIANEKSHYAGYNAYRRAKTVALKEASK